MSPAELYRAVATNSSKLIDWKDAKSESQKLVGSNPGADKEFFLAKSPWFFCQSLHLHFVSPIDGIASIIIIPYVERKPPE